jgi:hypothetical protein
MADSTKAPKGLLISGLVLLLLGLGGCIGGGAMAAGPVSDFVNSLSNLEDVPFGDTFEFAGTGSTAAIVVTGNSLCAAKDSSGQAVQLDQPSADFSGGSADQQFDVDSTFSTTEGETYQVVCDGSGDGSFAVVAFPENLSTIAAGAGIGIAGGLLMVIGVALLIASLIARSRWKKRQQPAAVPAAPGASYGGPAAPGAAEQYPGAAYPQQQYPAQQYPPQQFTPPPAPVAPPAPPAPPQYPTEPPQAPPQAPPAAPPAAPPPPPPGVG